MSSFSSPPTFPSKLKRKSLLASTSTSMDGYIRTLTPCSSPLQSSLAPLPRTRQNEYMEAQVGKYSDDPDGIAYAQQDKAQESAHPCSRCSRPEHSLPYMHRPLPSLLTKFAAHALRSDAPSSYNPSPFFYVCQTACCHLQGYSTTADNREEYDLESMNIHIRETYFATSAERGRWLSSPIASRVRSQAIPPTRGHSSPIKSVEDATSPRVRSRRHSTSCYIDKQIFTSSQDRDEDLPCSSSLPPSSPLTSPMSNFSLNEYCEGTSVVGPRSSSDECLSFIGTPELSVSSTSCTSPVDFMRTPSPRETPVSDPAHQPADFPCHPPRPVISYHTSPCSSKPVGLHVHASDIIDFGPDDILSPLSQFELDLPEVELPKLPLSDTMNKSYPGQKLATPGVTIDAAGGPEGPLPFQSMSMDSHCEPFDASFDTAGEPGSNKAAKKRRKPATSNARAGRSRRQAVIRSGSQSLDARKRGGTECRSSNHLEPPNKKSRLSHCGDDFESHGARSVRRRGEMSKAKRPLRIPSPPTALGCDSESPGPRDGNASKPIGHARLQHPAPSSFVATVDAVDTEFHASLTGMLIEALSTSRASSMDASALYIVLTQAHPHLSVKRSKEELLLDIAVVLEAGRTRCGMFEKVDGSGETSRHKALDGRWFYIPERDEDAERATLISAIMPRQKRNETKKYKQYYYRPLDKISRWDPEDAP